MWRKSSKESAIQGYNKTASSSLSPCPIVFFFIFLLFPLQKVAERVIVKIHCHNVDNDGGSEDTCHRALINRFSIVNKKGLLKWDLTRTKQGSRAC